MVGIDHNLAVPTLLAHVSPRVATAPCVLTLRAAELSKHPVITLVRGFLSNDKFESYM